MKTLLPTPLLLLCILSLFQGCATSKNAKKSKYNLTHEKFGNFYKIYVPNEAPWDLIGDVYADFIKTQPKPFVASAQPTNGDPIRVVPMFKS